VRLIHEDKQIFLKEDFNWNDDLKEEVFCGKT
jgi:hypothetical protein